MPDGARFYTHLSLDLHREHSVMVEICQEKAKGIKELPDYM